eukprot:SAG11_NODE_3059_length_2719_cov_1.506870_2_plen_259_part_00
MPRSAHGKTSTRQNSQPAKVTRLEGGVEELVGLWRAQGWLSPPVSKQRGTGSSLGKAGEQSAPIPRVEVVEWFELWIEPADRSASTAATAAPALGGGKPRDAAALDAAKLRRKHAVAEWQRRTGARPRMDMEAKEDAITSECGAVAATSVFRLTGFEHFEIGGSTARRGQTSDKSQPLMARGTGIRFRQSFATNAGGWAAPTLWSAEVEYFGDEARETDGKASETLLGPSALQLSHGEWKNETTEGWHGEFQAVHWCH